MSAFALFLIGVGVGGAVMWLLQAWHATDEPVHPRKKRDTEYWSVQRIAARIEEERRNVPRPGHHSRVGGPAVGVRPVAGWPIVASVG